MDNEPAIANSDAQVERVEAPLPHGAKPIASPNKYVSLYEIPSHMKISGPHHRIVLAVYDWDEDSMAAHFKHTISLSPPSSRDDAVKQGEHIYFQVFVSETCAGYAMLAPKKDEYVILRHKYGSGLEEDDKLGSWAKAEYVFFFFFFFFSCCLTVCFSFPEKIIDELKEVRGEMLGPSEEMGPNRAVFDTETNKFVGGIDFERTERAKPVKDAARAYSILMVNYAQRRLSTPSVQAKQVELVPARDVTLRSKILHSGSKAIMEGMSKGGSSLIETLTKQAELTNVPRIGSDCNVAHPAYQVNVASAVEPETLSRNGTTIASLGKFGGEHIDGNDTPGSPTSMLVLSHDYDGVEDDLFYLLDLGIAWDLEPLTALYFSGLHIHGGSQPVYRRDREDRNFLYYRITLIAYPVDEMLSGTDSISFGTLANGSLLPIGFDFRDASVFLLYIAIA
jgi:hypothetical protein